MAGTSRNIPNDIVISILSRLSVKSVMQYRCVCKSWHALVADSDFINMHLNQTCANNNGYVLMMDNEDKVSFCHGKKFVRGRKLELPFKKPLERFRIKGYCNGLLCLSCDGNRDIYLWNPSIQKFKALPDSEVQGHSSPYPKFSIMFLALGFVPQINDYKVIKFVYRRCGGGPFTGGSWGLFKDPHLVEIYSLRLNSWKGVRDVLPCLIDYCVRYSIVNGVVPWVARMDTYKGDRDCVFILSFDMANEVFGKIKLPERCRNDCVVKRFAMVVKELLSFFVSPTEGMNMRVDIWVMTKYGLEESWTKQFTFDQWRYFCPMGLMKNGDIVLIGDDGKMVSYDPIVQQVKDLPVFSHRIRQINLFTYYVDSLVLVNERN